MSNQTLQQPRRTTCPYCGVGCGVMATPPHSGDRASDSPPVAGDRRPPGQGVYRHAHVDTNSRLCMSSAVAAHKRAFGEDVVPGCFEDLELADLLVLTGSNTAWNHPVLYQRMKAADRPGRRVVVIDPRRTATAELADLHLALKPGTNPAVSLPDSARIREAMKHCPVVIVSDCIARTDTTELADILLPAEGWGEKGGTVTNSERCISRQRRFLPAAAP